MENENVETVEYEGPVCANCKKHEVEEGYRANLCKSCRESFVKRRIPWHIKGVVLLIILMVIVGITGIDVPLRANINYERGQIAEREKKYVTALNCYNKVAEAYPDSTIVLARTYITQFYNENVKESLQILNKIAGREVEDDALVDEINKIVDRTKVLYYYDVEFQQYLEGNQDRDLKELAEDLSSFCKDYPNNITVVYYYASSLFDLEKYDEARSVMEKIMPGNEDCYSGHLLIAATYRETGNYEKAIEACDRVLNQNAEYVSAISSKARIELKLNNVKSGLALAQKAYKLDENNPYSISTLALAYHYNNMNKERDNMFEAFKKYSENDEYNISLLTNIFNGKLKWREK